jgi:alcohol dehydrogenase
MRSLTVVGPGAVEWREAPAPVLQADSDVLVRPIVSSACDLDRRLVRGPSPFEPPYALGHEAVGEVVEVGGDGPLRPGDRVVVPWHISCGACDACAHAMPGACRTVPRLASYGTTAGGRWGGLFDEVVRVPWASANLVALPDGVDPVVAAFCSDNLVDAYRAVSPTLAARPGAAVLVVGGTATLGLLTVMSAVALKSARVVYVDRSPARVEAAARLGAAAELVEDYPGRVDGDFDLAVDVSAHPDGLRCALRSARPGGACVARSVYFTEPPLPYFDLYGTGVTFMTGPPHATPFIPEVLAHLASGTLDPGAVLAGPYPYDQAPEVLLDPPAGKPAFVHPRPAP